MQGHDSHHEKIEHHNSVRYNVHGEFTSLKWSAPFEFELLDFHAKK
ncbi:hypothetical protein SELSPUOL_00204 [Selenomonas sputigena ATCC 35185]|uniref:Uncharacterized protein n=1 Tax=Selenomonas sputigena (strain ATCC 35185 / DSM 20758 / CCUG 44933 / VPI D19B-28) TaxID=546271 RepID=C9LRY4_SELS3|nr:hypothetical protein SELSPUOL_00204 [Selenomonas sputigena ATCC 35185]